MKIKIDGVQAMKIAGVACSIVGYALSAISQHKQDSTPKKKDDAKVSESKE